MLGYRQKKNKHELATPKKPECERSGDAKHPPDRSIHTLHSYAFSEFQSTRSILTLSPNFNPPLHFYTFSNFQFLRFLQFPILTLYSYAFSNFQFLRSILTLSPNMNLLDFFKRYRTPFLYIPIHRLTFYKLRFFR